MEAYWEILKERRSIRQFQRKSIPEEFIFKIVNAVQWSPSWANTQCWEVIHIQNQEIRSQIQKTVSPRNPAYQAIIEAPLLLALVARRKQSGYYKGKPSTLYGDWFMYDLGIVTQTVCLAARALGLGSVIVGLFDHKKASDILEIPIEYALVSLIPIGYPANHPKAPRRKTPDEYMHVDRFKKNGS
jgi:nitroreductase